jgi:hypothetical protein
MVMLEVAVALVAVHPELPPYPLFDDPQPTNMTIEAARDSMKRIEHLRRAGQAIGVPLRP